jgi:hypothetical protein
LWQDFPKKASRHRLHTDRKAIGNMVAAFKNSSQYPKNLAKPMVDIVIRE